MSLTRIITGQGVTNIVHGGLLGQQGPPADPTESSASGTVSTPQGVWLLSHNLGFDPAGREYLDEFGNPMEPESEDYINTNNRSATWPTPVRGSWKVS